MKIPTRRSVPPPTSVTQTQPSFFAVMIWTASLTVAVGRTATAGLGFSASIDSVRIAPRIVRTSS